MNASDDKARWLDERQSSVGGSEAATVMHEHPFDTLLQLYLRKRGEAPEVAENERMRLGHFLEPYIAKRYEEETGRETADLGAYTIQRRDDVPDMHATLDRVVRPDGVLQLKSVGSRMAAKWRDGETPRYVSIQLQHEMFVAKCEWGSVAAILSGTDFVWQDQHLNERFCYVLADACRQFMEGVRNGIQPAAEAGDLEVVRLLYPTVEPGKAIELPESAVELTNLIDTYGAMADGINKIVDGAKARLLQLVGDAETAEVPGGNGAWVCKTVKRKGYVVEDSEYRQLRRRK